MRWEVDPEKPDIIIPVIHHKGRLPICPRARYAVLWHGLDLKIRLFIASDAKHLCTEVDV